MPTPKMMLEDLIVLAEAAIKVLNGEICPGCGQAHDLSQDQVNLLKRNLGVFQP